MEGFNAVPCFFADDFELDPFDFTLTSSGYVCCLEYARFAKIAALREGPALTPPFTFYTFGFCLGLPAEDLSAGTFDLASSTAA